MVRSLAAHSAGAELAIWDLGLTEAERTAFETEFTPLKLRTFNYANYPPFYDIRVAAGQYAWKSACIEESLAGWPADTVVLWLDAGNLLVGSLREPISFIKKQGLFSPMTGGSISRYIHPGTFAATGVSQVNLTKKTMRNGAIIGFYTGFPWVKSWFTKWRKWCDTECVIAPAGSDRSNHRQDQAILTITYWEIARERGLNHMRDFDTVIKTHCDCDA